MESQEQIDNANLLLTKHRLKLEWNQMVWSVNNLRCGTAGSAGSSSPAASPAATKTAVDPNALITGAAKDLADYQRLTAEGKLGEAGQKLEQLKHKLDELSAHQK